MDFQQREERIRIIDARLAAIERREETTNDIETLRYLAQERATLTERLLNLERQQGKFLSHTSVADPPPPLSCNHVFPSSIKKIRIISIIYLSLSFLFALG